MSTISALNSEEPPGEKLMNGSNYSPINTPSQTSSLFSTPEKMPLKNGPGKVAPSGTPAEKENDKEEKEEKKEDVVPVGVFHLFRFADVWDKLFMFLGTFGALCHGAALPLMVIVFGDMTDSFVLNEIWPNLVDYLVEGLESRNRSVEWFNELFGCNLAADDCSCVDKFLNSSLYDTLPANLTSQLPYEPDEICGSDALMDQMRMFSIYYAAIGAGVLLFGYMQVSFWAMAAERQINVIRVKFFEAVMRQQIGWFDIHHSGGLSTRLSDDVAKMQAGMGDKLGIFVQWTTCCLTGFIIGFVKGWKLSLVIISVSPLLAIAAGFMSKLATEMTSRELSAYAKAGAIAEEVFMSIRTVVAFGGERKEAERYEKNLADAKKIGIQKGLTTGTGLGLTWMLIFCVYSLAFWYGSRLVREDPEYTAGTLMTVFFAVMIGAFAMGHAAAPLSDFANARGAASKVYEIIDTVPVIDSQSTSGEKPSNIVGNIEFKDVHFQYPSRPDVKVLKGLNLRVENGQTVALVGPSGCGKSTVVQLIQRLYDTINGSVMLDGRDIKTLNVKWLRDNIGIVSQEPVLFGTTIGENIRYGRDGVSQTQIEDAAREANAHNFIMKLPQKYNTLVGERGAQLSGGQKQRIAIARALVRNPRILLLDEATSALDTESEATVQAALDNARLGRTTVVIAHRLSTIKNADKIVPIELGVSVEEGSHAELMKKGGVYYHLVMAQSEGLEDIEENEAAVISYTDLSGSPKTRSESHVSVKRVLSRQISRGMSVTSIGSDKPAAPEVDEDDVSDLPPPSTLRLMKLNSPEWPFIAVGTFCAMANGTIMPIFAVLFAEVLGVFSIIDLEEQEKESNWYALLFLLVGIAAGATMFLQVYFFGISGESLTKRLRYMGFTSMLRQEIGWFDDRKNTVGALMTRLATDASNVQGATGARLGSTLNGFASIACGLAIAFSNSWQLTLVILAFTPFIMLGGVLQMKMLAGNAHLDKDALENSGRVATEGIDNIRTVASLSKEKHFVNQYSSSLRIPFKNSMIRCHLYGIAFSFSQGIIFFAYSACFYYGAVLIEEKGLDYEKVFKVFSAIVFGAMSLGQASSFAPDFAKAKTSSQRVLHLFDRVPLIDSSSPDGEKPSTCIGRIQFKSVNFNYPSRPDVPVLVGFDLTIDPSQMVALVGSSGCGKSTTVQLLERFYDPLEGQVMIDGKDIKNLNIQWLRQQLGIVSQEPVLFDATIAENISYGDNERNVLMDEIIAAARSANIHTFIQSLPEGYATNVGEKGTQLSGGQKQRIAIARALIRNPRILLLDEATSALDTESERVVQDALDNAQKGRTSVTIAHRLSTIYHSDKIAVINHGKVAEEGQHADLLATQGLYYILNNAQLKDRKDENEKL